MQRCCKCGVVLGILPCQITKSGQFKDSKWPLKKSRFCARDHFESLNWPHLVIRQCRITKPYLQHSCIGNFMQPVLNSFLGPFLVFGLFSPPPPHPHPTTLYLNSISFCSNVERIRGGGGGAHLRVYSQSFCFPH